MSGDLKIKNPKFPGIYRARVEDNTDPDMIGRVRARAVPMFTGIITARLPWAVPAFGLFEGAGDNIGCITIPSVDSWVFVFFENGDMYQPVYFANAPTGKDSKKGIPSDLSDVNYPERKVWRTKSGVEIYIDDTDVELKVSHPAGCSIKIDQSGNIEIDTAGKIDVTATGAIKIAGATVEIN